MPVRPPHFISLSIAVFFTAILMLAVGAAGAVNSTLFLGLSIIAGGVLAIAVFFAASSLIEDISTVDEAGTRDSRYSQILLYLSIFACVTSIVIGALLPVTARDALVHHLFVAQQWCKTGVISAIPTHEWSRYPQFLQILYAGAYRLSAPFPSLPNFSVIVHGSFLLLTAASVARLTKTLGGSASLAATITVTIPVLLTLSAEPLVDLGLLYAASVTVLSINAGYRDWFVSVGVAMACASKPNGMLFAAVVIPAFLYPTRSPRRTFSVCLFAMLFYLPFGYWCFLQSGDPIYPMAKSFFGPAPVIVNGAPIFHGLSLLEQRIYLYGESIAEVLLLPLRVFWQGEEGNPKYFDGALTPILLLALFAFRSSVGKRERWLVAMSVLYLLFACCLTVMRVRYLVPCLPGLIVSTACVVSRYRKAIIPVQLVSLVFALYLTVFSDPTLPLKKAYLLGEITTDEYLEQLIPEYPVIRYANANLAADSVVAPILTGNQFALYRNRIIASGHTSGDFLLSALRTSADGQELAAKMRAEGITDILVSQQRLFDLVGSVPELQGKLEIFKSTFEPEFEENGFVLAKVR